MKTGGETVRDAGEFGCIERVCHDLLYRPELVRTGAGDDGAVYVSPPGMDQVISTDTMVEGIHFLRETMDAPDVGWKLCVSNFSDMAAMGAEPVQFVVAASLPDTLPLRWLSGCYDGIREACRAYGVNLLGGDTTGSRQGVVLTGTVIGIVPECRAVLRSGVREGDLLAVTGTLGDSAAGLDAIFRGQADRYPRLSVRHRRPVPQIRAAKILREAGVHALDDITDGLASEAHEIARASGMDLLLRGGAVPLSDELRGAAAAFGKDPLAYALFGGEDYQLLAAGSRECFETAAKEVPLTVIGRVLGRGGGVYIEKDTGREWLPRGGYDHFKENSVTGG